MSVQSLSLAPTIHGLPRSLGAPALIELGIELSRLGLLPATSGNLSLRLDDGHVLMTRSGVEKGQLGEHDLLLARPDLPAPAGASAEAPLHLALYHDRPDTGCVLHVHSRAAAVLSRLHGAHGAVTLQGWELQKAVRGQASPDDALTLPVFANWQDTVALAERVAQHLAHHADVQAYLLEGHGLYTWGRTPAEARRHVIALEELMHSELDLRRLR